MDARFAEEALAALKRVGVDLSAAVGGGVGAVTVRVVAAGDEALVVFERRSEGLRVSCSCGQRSCGHLARAVEAFVGAGASARSRWSVVAPAPGPGVEASPPGAASPARDDVELGRLLRELLELVLADGVAVGSERIDAALEDLVRRLAGTDAFGLHRSLADLRREMATSRPLPGRLLRAVEVLERTARALEAQAAGAPGDSVAYDLLVGRDRPLHELETREELTLLEVARNSARTPFGYRRLETFLVDLATGARYTELVALAPGCEASPRASRYAGSVGPFPRLVRADLVAVAPGPSPRRIQLLQYRVDLQAGADEIRQLMAVAATDVPALYAEFRELAGALGVAYPCFALFAPARVLVRDGEATLVDAADRVLPLARAVAPDICAAADRHLTRGRPGLVVGHLLLLRRTLALAPLAVLVDSPRGERLVPLR